MDARTVPEVIERYQTAHDRRDASAAVAAFAPDATVVDDGRTYDGALAIRSWLEHAASEYTFTRTRTGAASDGDGRWTIRNRLEGDFPGGTVDLAYRFTLRDGEIVRLEIAP